MTVGAGVGGRVGLLVGLRVGEGVGKVVGVGVGEDVGSNVGLRVVGAQVGSGVVVGAGVGVGSRVGTGVGGLTGDLDGDGVVGTGVQGWVLHLSSSLLFGQVFPPLVGAFKVRVLFLLPPPHGCEHLLHLDHFPITQLHLPILHALFCAAGPQALAPLPRGDTSTVLLRVCRPALQGSSHSLHALHGLCLHGRLVGGFVSGRVGGFVGGLFFLGVGGRVFGLDGSRVGL